MIAIIDYGMGNLRSVQKALESVGAQACIVTSAEDIKKANKLVLPGVGAMKPAMDRLEELKLVKPIKDFIASGKPFLGICLGFQLLFDTSFEGGTIKGLGVLAGTVERFPSTVKAPQMGWNQLRIVQKDCPMYKGVAEGAFVYFCHSYFTRPKEMAFAATLTEHGLVYASSVCKGNVWGAQFHPEKSQAVGLKILENFVLC
jgi:imidazole glycerol-phosphate synthase subunit HisH